MVLGECIFGFLRNIGGVGGGAHFGCPICETANEHHDLYGYFKQWLDMVVSINRENQYRPSAIP